jgi:CRP/FNR family transcriptional regulator, cyclic AMP receptor protein
MPIKTATKLFLQGENTAQLRQTNGLFSSHPGYFMGHQEDFTLADIPFFSGLPELMLQRLMAQSISKTYPKNTVLINEGDENDALYVIINGQVKIYMSNADGKEMLLGQRGYGTVFGMFELFDPGPCLCSVMTVERSRICVIPRTVLHACLLQYTTPDHALLQAMAQHIRLLTGRIKLFALDSVYQRLVYVLQELASDVEGQLVVANRPTHQELANQIGASREMVSRILRTLTIGGYIRIENGSIIIQKKFPSAW